MQHERVWPASQPAASENVGDVLASIRRLIAQDQSRLPQAAAAPLAHHPLANPPHAAGRPPLARVVPGQHAPFVLGRKDMVGDSGPAAAMPAGQPHPQPARSHAVTAAQRLDASSRWRSEPLPDWPNTDWPNSGWPQPGGPQALPMQTAGWPQPGAQQATDRASVAAAAPLAAAAEPDPGLHLSPEDEAEFAEAEAALARMTAPRTAGPAPESQPQAPFEPAAIASAPQDQDLTQHTTSIEETQMAQDMRMMEMGRMDNFAAVPPNAAPGGYDPLRGSAEAAPNLFGEIGAVAKDATMRMLIRDAIQQELHGELGARLSRNMCQMIRQEVEAVIREICAEQ